MTQADRSSTPTRNMIQRFFCIVLAVNLLPGCASTAECHLTDDDFEVSSQEEIEQWYEQYKGCENDPNVSSDVLFSLALLIGWAEIDGYPANRPDHVYDLVYRAPKLGNREALIDLAYFYDIGFKEVGIYPDKDVSLCLDGLADIVPVGDADFSIPVSRCLVLAD